MFEILKNMKTKNNFLLKLNWTQFGLHKNYCSHIINCPKFTDFPKFVNTNINYYESIAGMPYTVIKVKISNSNKILQIAKT